MWILTCTRLLPFFFSVIYFTFSKKLFVLLRGRYAALPSHISKPYFLCWLSHAAMALFLISADDSLIDSLFFSIGMDCKWRKLSIYRGLFQKCGFRRNIFVSGGHMQNEFGNLNSNTVKDSWRQQQDM